VVAVVPIQGDHKGRPYHRRRKYTIPLPTHSAKPGAEKAQQPGLEEGRNIVYLVVQMGRETLRTSIETEDFLAQIDNLIEAG
jgi:hypothetical protein